MNSKYKKFTSIVALMVMVILPATGYGLKTPKRFILGPGNYIRNIQIEDTKRYYKVHVPPSYNKTKPVPVVLEFHGAGGYPDAIRYQTGMDIVSDENGFIVVYPAGNNEMREDGLLRWNDGRNYKDGSPVYIDDVGFVETLLDDLARFFYIDTQRVYACGISNGALFAYHLAKQLPDRLAANFAHQIPQGYFQRPHPAIVKLQVVEQAHMALDVERVLADKERLVAGKAQHGIAGTDALVSAGPYPDDGAGVTGTRLRVPRGAKGRVER